MFLLLRRQHPFLHKTKGPTRNPISPTPPPLLRRASMSPPRAPPSAGVHVPPPPPPAEQFSGRPLKPRTSERKESVDLAPPQSHLTRSDDANGSTTSTIPQSSSPISRCKKDAHFKGPWKYQSAQWFHDSGGGRGGGCWHKASVLRCVPLAAPIGLSPLLILTLCGSERVLVVSTEPPDDLSCLTTPGVGRPGDGAVAPCR